MAGDYEKAISILEAVEKIRSNDFLLPAIQRKFVWSSHQICVLFDSLMRGYPINSFMMWEVTDADIKNNYKFYQFIQGYCQRFNEENPHLPTNASSKDFKAVIDGQQRLTSLYIGLCSTYAYKQPRIWWPSAQDDNVLPPRKLYLDLLNPIDSDDNESMMQYSFRFLTDKQFKSSKEVHHWYCLHDLLKEPSYTDSDDVLMNVVLPYISKHELNDNTFARKTLLKLYSAIRNQKLIHYFNEKEQKIDHVLDVFIRTNSGGTKLDFSDLLMSIAVANWNGDFRKEIDTLVKEINQSAEMGFYLGRDWILKTCLMLTNSDVKFKVKNFKAEQVAAIQNQWEEIKQCIKETFKAVRRFGINPQSLTSKNAVIPICYYLFTKQVGGEPLFHTINNLAKADEQRKTISQWFYMALLKGVFGGQADTVLSGMRDVLKQNMNSPIFPLGQIIEKYKGSNKDLRFDAEYLDNLLDIQHGEGRCRALLHLLFPEMNPTETFHIDHLHPQSAFDKNNLKTYEFLKGSDELMDFFSEPKHWNGIANLHLLNDSQNISKNAKPLVQWIGCSGVTVTKSNLLLDENANLELEYFNLFYEQRRTALKERLQSRVFMTDVLDANVIEGDSDEEVVEEAIAI
ncbi:hypothetical protein A8139_14835 [Marinomonas primoryensis]|uniref:GmrSD restriction endonucleases N-terminal domain-containing protein n=1 Tax=Marinomonas primoryensis TaxID=178399 RepID=A0A2Z4PUH0_9GAMM|nr:DUF262 domain-containing protein [Marinomonas primoryensis]AWY01110.1 hypothetical protein A8139_14835 [Marinomonas primoryensis]